MTSQLPGDALMMAMWHRGERAGQIRHTTQCTSEHFLEWLKEQGMVCSMSRTNEVWGNLALERYFRSLKTESARKVCQGHEQARADVFKYIENFYDPVGRHSTLGCVRPAELEKGKRRLGRCPRDRQQADLHIGSVP